jgi:hypothetical protein
VRAAVFDKMHLGGFTTIEIDRCLDRLELLRQAWLDIAEIQTRGDEPFAYAGEQPVRRLLQDPGGQRATMADNRKLFEAARSMRETEPVSLLRLRTPSGAQF